MLRVMLILFVGMILVKAPDNAVYGVREVYRLQADLKDGFDVVIDSLRNLMTMESPVYRPM
jgi:hypothetical protein